MGVWVKDYTISQVLLLHAGGRDVEEQIAQGKQRSRNGVEIWTLEEIHELVCSVFFVIAPFGRSPCSFKSADIRKGF